MQPDRGDWTQAVRSAPDEIADEKTARWRHPGLEDLLARAAALRPDLRAALRDRDPIVATNAAIALARLGDDSATERLARAVRTPEMKLPIRLAAAEALGATCEPSPVERLRELIDQYGDRERTGQPRPAPELHAELLRSLARHVDAADDARFLNALRSPAADVRLVAVQAWSAGRHGTLPVEAIDLRADHDPRVRAAALTCLAWRRHPEAPQHLAAGLDDCDLRVRIAAIAGLGEMGGSEAQATLEELLEDRGEVIRAGAVAALAALGAEQSVFDAAGDKSWRVRLEVARALVRCPSVRGAAVAGQLVDDPSAMVRQETIASLAEWPLAQAGPVLLAAMGKSGYMTRKEAAQRLAALWPPAAEFPVDGPRERRAEVLGRLRRRWQHEIGPADAEGLAASALSPPMPSVSPQQIEYVDQLVRQLSDPGVPESTRRQSVEALRQFGPGLPEALEQVATDRQTALPEVIYRDVLPDSSPAFRLLDQLASQDVAIRRRAARELADLAQKRPLGRLAVAQLHSLAATETDPLVWQNVLAAVADDPSEPAIRLACAAIGHPSPEVRLRACQHLAAHARRGQEHTEVLLPALEDENPLVVRAAVRALAAVGGMDDAAPVKRLLLASDDLVRLEAAVALCRLGDPAGPPALERLSYSSDPAVRRQVAVAMGEIALPSFTPFLGRLLDDHHSVCLAALEALPKVAGHDVAQAAGPSRVSVTERIERWKRWLEGEQHTAGGL